MWIINTQAASCFVIHSGVLLQIVLPSPVSKKCWHGGAGEAAGWMFCIEDAQIFLEPILSWQQNAPLWSLKPLLGKAADTKTEVEGQPNTEVSSLTVYLHNFLQHEEQCKCFLLRCSGFKKCFYLLFGDVLDWLWLQFKWNHNKIILVMSSELLNVLF